MNTPRLFKKKSQSYPDVSLCLGTRVGHFHGREWWIAAGPAKELFDITAPDILRQLQDAVASTYYSELRFRLYMIGKCKDSARPTIMFFGEDLEPRKKAKKTIDQGGILKRLPGFKTGHQAREPNFGELIQPATVQVSSNEEWSQLVDIGSFANNSTHGAAARLQQHQYETSKADPIVRGQIDAPITAPDVYYDPTYPTVAVGMPIFVRRDNEVYRRATAYAVMKKDTCLLMTVSHVLRDGTITSVQTGNVGDDEFDFGSDTEDEMDEDLTEITSRASVSSRSSTSDTELSSIQSLIRSNPMDIDCSLYNEADMSTPIGISSRTDFSDPVNRFRKDNVSRLKYLGKVSESCANQDWALITIEEPRMAENLRYDLAQVSELAKYQIGTQFDDEEVLLQTSIKSQGLVGKLSGNPSYVRLPGSPTFEQLYHISLEEPIEWGDCGAVALGATTRALYGHVVASSDDRRVALIIPAHRVLKTSQTQWKAIYRMNNSIPDRNGNSLASTGGFKFITAERPADFKRKENMTVIRKQAMDLYLNPDCNPKLGPSSIAFPSSQSPETISPMMPVMASLLRGSLPHYARTPPVFRSIGKTLDPFQTLFQSSHPQVSVEELKNSCSHYFGTKSLGKYWIPTMLQDPHAFLGTLCLATAYSDAIHELPSDSVQTVALQNEIIHLVGRNMLDPKKATTDHNLAAVMLLIASDFNRHGHLTIKYHGATLKTMIKQRGGLEKIRTPISSMITWVSVVVAIFQEREPRDIYSRYCKLHCTYSYAASRIIPESPLYRPHTRPMFLTLPRSKNCSQKALQLLVDFCTMLDIFLGNSLPTGSENPSLSELHKRICDAQSYPPLAEIIGSHTSPVVRESHWRYEAIRLTALLANSAIMSRSKMSNAVPENSLKSFDPLFISTRVPGVSSGTKYQADSSNLLLSVTEQLKTLSEVSTPSPSMLQDSDDESQGSPTWFSPSSSVASFTSSKRCLERPALSESSGASEYVYFPPPSQPSRRRLSTRDTILSDLHEALKISNMSECWSEMAGVLLWISLTAAAASRNSELKVSRKYFVGVAIRTSFMLCFEHPEAINATVLRMSEFINKLNSLESSSKV